jgi:ankyrin repeat protein
MDDQRTYREGGGGGLAPSLELFDEAHKGDPAEISRLLKIGADPNFRDVLHGGTCLHEAISGNNIAVIELLLAHGADPNISTQNTSSTPLGLAALKGSDGIVRLLVSRGATLSDLEVATGLIQECLDLGFTDIAGILRERANAKNNFPRR